MMGKLAFYMVVATTICWSFMTAFGTWIFGFHVMLPLWFISGLGVWGSFYLRQFKVEALPDNNKSSSIDEQMDLDQPELSDTEALNADLDNQNKGQEVKGAVSQRQVSGKGVASIFLWLILVVCIVFMVGVALALYDMSTNGWGDH